MTSIRSAIVLYLAVASLVSVPVTAAPPAAAQHNTPQAAKPNPAPTPPPPQHRKCDVGQVLKWGGQHWACADDLTGSGGSGGGSGPQIVDADGTAMGPMVGTTTPSGGLTVPTILLTLGEDPKAFLLAVDEGGFVSDGTLFVHSTGEAVACATSCGFDAACLKSCASATAACAVENARLAPAAPTSPLFRAGSVVDGTLWVATSSTLEPVGECVNFGLPACATMVFNPADDTCTLDIVLGGSENQRLAYPAVPLSNLHTVYPRPYTLRPR